MISAAEMAEMGKLMGSKVGGDAANAYLSERRSSITEEQDFHGRGGRRGSHDGHESDEEVRFISDDEQVVG